MRYENVWLYKFQNKKITLRQGTVVSDEDLGLSTGRFSYRNGKKYHSVYVSAKEATFYNSMVWLKERNDKKAILAFQKHKKQQILDLASSFDKARSELTFLYTCEEDLEVGETDDCRFVQLL